MVYSKSDDTFLMEKTLTNYNLEGKKVLEIGIGNGYNAIKLAKRGAFVFGLDIDPSAIDYVKTRATKEKTKINLVESDMFSKLREYNFDIIYFNPPYLVSDKIKHIDLDGGIKGREVINKFLDSFDKYLKDDGFALLLHTDYNDIKETEQKLNKKNFKMKIVENQKLFFEELYILEIRR